jgi:hypothetical protein
MLVVYPRTTITIGAGLGGLILKHFEKTVEQHREKSAEQWSHPVDPMVTIEAFRGDVRTERACWVERSTSVENTYQCQYLVGIVVGLRLLTS